MKITIESTPQIVSLDEVNPGTKARHWTGTTESGIKVDVFITLITVHKAADCTQFEKELKEIEPLPAVYRLRDIL